MNFKGIEKKEAGKFITRYDITYETVDNQKKVYEIISRKKNMETYEALHGDKPDAVVIIATNETGDKLLVNKEFRLAVISLSAPQIAISLCPCCKALCFQQFSQFLSGQPAGRDFLYCRSTWAELTPCFTDNADIDLIAESYSAVAWTDKIIYFI